MNGGITKKNSNRISVELMKNYVTYNTSIS